MRREMVVVAIFVIAGTAGMSGCVSAFNEKGEKQVRRKAGFQLDCASSQLRLTQLETNGGGFIVSYGVQGCGHRAVYKHVVSNTSGPNFVMESASGGVEAAREKD